MAAQHTSSHGKIILPAILLLMSELAKANGDISLSAGYQFSSGDYGQARSTDIETFSATLQYSRNAWRSQLTVPHLRITGNGSVVPGAGATVFSDNDLEMFTGSGSGFTESSPATQNRLTRQGLGDITFKLGYRLLTNSATGNWLELSGKIKLASANANQALGTGENDYFLQLDGSLGNAAIIPFFTLGYVVTGDTEPLRYRDVPYASLGLVIQPSPTVSLGFSVDYQSRLLRNTDDLQQLNAFGEWRVTADNAVSLSLLRGLTNNSLDQAASISFNQNF